MTNQHDFTDTMSPIIELMYSQMRMEQENEVMKAVQSIGVNVDKERLIQALTDAHRFWQEGYDACLQWKPRWISVEEALPEPFVSVLVYMPGERPLPTVHEGFLAREGVWYANHFDREPEEITHWMPLPKAPTEEEV